MDFEEFLWAKGYSDELSSDMLKHMLTLTPFSALEMTRFSDLFLDYIVLGGMPAIIADHIRHGTFENTLELQKQLLWEYRNDIRKYAEGLDQTKIISVFESIPSQLAKDNKKFQFSQLSSKARARDYWGCIEWLNDSGIVKICYCLAFPSLPLQGNLDRAKFKLYLADSGLLLAMLDKEARDDLRINRNLGIYKGALYENFVAEALYKSGYALAYYKREDSALEEDFFIRGANHLYPLEVKATNGKSKTLSTLIASEHYPDIVSGIKMAMANIGVANKITTFPYFCAFLLSRFMEEKKDL